MSILQRIMSSPVYSIMGLLETKGYRTEINETPQTVMGTVFKGSKAVGMLIVDDEGNAIGSGICVDYEKQATEILIDIFQRRAI